MIIDIYPDGMEKRFFYNINTTFKVMFIISKDSIKLLTSEVSNLDSFNVFL